MAAVAAPPLINTPLHALQPLQLLLELLIAVLQLFHIAGEIADRGLEAVDAGDEIGGNTWARAAPAQTVQASATTVREAEQIIAGDIFGGSAIRSIAWPASKL